MIGGAIAHEAPHNASHEAQNHSHEENQPTMPEPTTSATRPRVAIIHVPTIDRGNHEEAKRLMARTRALLWSNFAAYWGTDETGDACVYVIGDDCAGWTLEEQCERLASGLIFARIRDNHSHEENQR